MNEVERIVSSIGWIQVGTTDDSQKINRAIDLLRSQAARIEKLEMAAQGVVDDHARYESESIELQELTARTDTLAACLPDGRKEPCPNKNCISGMEQFDSGVSMTCGMCGGTGIIDAIYDQNKGGGV